LTDPSKDIQKIRWYTPKEKRGIVSRLGDPHKRQDDSKTVRYELYGSDLFKKETLLKPFLGMKLITYPSNDIGELKSAFGTSGKFRVVFPAGTTAKENDTLRLPFKRFLYDTEKKMCQDDIIFPSSRSGSRIDPPVSSTQSKKDKKKKKKDLIEATGTVDKVKGDPISGGSGSGGGCEDDAGTKKTITTTKLYPTAIISGLFTPDIDIKSEMVGRTVYIPSTKQYGIITGPFGKAGKCKVDFIKNGRDDEEEESNTNNDDNDNDNENNNLNGISETAVGSKAELHRT
jgi:selenocysteine-specific elongation factor